MMNDFERNRIYMADIEAMCKSLGAQIVQHHQTRTFTVVLEGGAWGWVINSYTGNTVKKISELTLNEWRDHLLITIEDIKGSVRK